MQNTMTDLTCPDEQLFLDICEMQQRLNDVENENTSLRSQLKDVKLLKEQLEMLLIEESTEQKTKEKTKHPKRNQSDFDKFYHDKKRDKDFIEAIRAKLLALGYNEYSNVKIPCYIIKSECKLVYKK